MKILFTIIQSFFIFGDIGYYSDPLSTLVNNVKENVKKNDNKIILMGDNFYNYGILKENDEQWKQYEDVFSTIPSDKIFALMGNHDYYGNPKIQLNTNHFKNNEFYFKKTFSNIDLYFLDTAPLHEGHCEVDNTIFKQIHNKCAEELKQEQLKWLETELEKSVKNGRKKIVFGHYPVISNGFYYFKLRPLYETLIPLFEKYKVDAYVSGHEHNVQHIKRTISKDYTFNQFIIGSSSETRRNGFINPFHNSLFDNSNHFMMEIIQKNRSLHFRFINEENIIQYLIII